MRVSEPVPTDWSTDIGGGGGGGICSSGGGSSTTLSSSISSNSSIVVTLAISVSLCGFSAKMPAALG
jgi:hypothetical protein